MKADQRSPGATPLPLCNLHLKTDARDATPPAGQALDAAGSAGAFGRFLREHPTIRRAVNRAIAEHKRAGSARAGVHTAQALHRRFLRACLRAGIAASAYPLNTPTRGQRALERYVHRKLGTQPAAEDQRGAGEGSHRSARPGDGDDS